MKDKLRLPKHVTPVNYDIHFDVDAEKTEFCGKERIELNISRPASAIVLHSSGLKVSGAAVLSGGRMLKARLRENMKLEQLILEFDGKIFGDASLLIEFCGEITDSMTGIYRSAYSSGGRKKHIVTTQFEASYARRAFPCFDEPCFKATFDVSMRIRKDLTAISNMPAKSQRADGAKKVVSFQRTPRMSTYLLYLGAGEFEFLEGKSGKTLIRVATTPGKKRQAAFALDMTKKFLKYFEDYSGIRYPLPKLDMIAVPDFASGAMENWGAITFREVLLLFDHNVTSISVKKRITEVIAHELWHQWSGNLVTMEWWNDLWLNESFATFMAYKAVDRFFPEWEMWKDFMLSETDIALDADSVKNTHPIEAEIRDPVEISEIFDSISYNKGGSVLRMLEGYAGAENFRKGVSAYLKKHKYGNATATDLWGALGRASGHPVKKMAATWIRQPGYPLVSVKLRGRRLSLSQKRFVFGLNDRTLWPVPVVMRSGKSVFSCVLEKREKSIRARGGWLKANYGQSGFYRVKYDGETLSRLSGIIEGKKIPAEDRWGVQSDLFRLSRHGEIGLDEYMDFSKNYANEDDYTVLRSVFGSMQSIHFVFSKEGFWKSVEPGFLGLFSGTFERVVGRLGWEPRNGEPEKDAMLRNLALVYLGFARHADTARTAMEKFAAYCNGKPLHPNIRTAVFSIASDNGDFSTYRKFLKAYARSASQEEKVQILSALGNFRDPRLLVKALDFSISDKVRRQDFYSTFASVSGNPVSRGILLDWTERNWKKLESYREKHSLFIHIIESLITAYVTRDMEKRMRKFFGSHPVEYRMTVEKSFDRMRRNASWLEGNRKKLEKYFAPGVTTR